MIKKKTNEKPEKNAEQTRYNPDPKVGLKKEQVESRKKEGLVNFDTTVPTKGVKRIIFDHFVTLFNLLNLLLGLAIFAVGSYKNLLFLGVVICNTVISTYQELHAKKVVDQLSVLAQSNIKVRRDRKEEEVTLEEIVLDDILILKPGDQIAVDFILQEGEVEVN